MRLSVVIPAYNEERRLPGTLARLEEALRQSRLDGDWEIVVCDNASTDATAVLARESGARVVHEPHRQIGAARNCGAAVAKGEWLLFLDADSAPSVELLNDTFRSLRETNALGCGSTIEVEDGTLFNRLRMERLNPLFRLFGLAGGVYLAVRRDAFEHVGGFADRLYALEEIEFLIRLKRYGRRRGQRFVVHHRHPVRTSGRKGEYRIGDLLRIVAADIAATALLVAFYVLPEKMRPRRAPRLLGYWYATSRSAAASSTRARSSGSRPHASPRNDL